MADITVHINRPILVTGQSFKVRYRELPAGTFSAPQTESNTPFTITGLVAGSSYQIEFIVVNEDLSECPASYFTVVAQEFGCPDFEVVQQGDGITTPYELLITYTLPGGYAAPCKWYVRVKQASASGGWQAANYPVLPTSPFTVPLPTLPVQDYDVQIYADQCTDEFKYCFNDTVAAPEPVPCEPFEILDTSITLSNANNGYPKVLIQIDGIQSTPATVTTTLYAIQRNVNIVPPNLPRTYTGAMNFPLNVPPASGIYGFGMILSPTKTNIYIVDVHFTDNCGVMHTFTVTLDLS